MAGMGASHREETRLKAARILIIDDEPIIRETLSLILSQNYYVKAAGDGTEALNLLEIYEPDLMLTDLSMPDMSGFELIRNVRAVNNTIKIIAYSALFHRPEEQELIIKAGADICLAKPTPTPLLQQAINGLLTNTLSACRRRNVS